jgi:signal transduction histidine kinase
MSHPTQGDQEIEANARAEALEELRRAERMETASRLASFIAHELGTPLNVVAGRASMIASGEVTGDEAAKSAKIIVEQTSKLTTTIKQFLAEIRKPPRRVTSEVAPLAARAIELVSRAAAQMNAEIVFERPSEHLTVNIEPIKFIQILTQILTNAIEASPKGGKIEMGMKRETRSPANSPSRRGSSFVCVTIRDYGEGIEKDQIPNIFKLFYSTRAKAGGAGLGLSIAQGIVREHGGWIDVESEPEKGSRFMVFLPEGGA